MVKDIKLNIILKYVDASPTSVSGIFAIERNNGMAKIPRIVMTKDAATVINIAVFAHFFTISRFFAPKYCDNLMLTPDESPTNRVIIKRVAGFTAPTAEKAESPTKLPTTQVSTKLYSC